MGPICRWEGVNKNEAADWNDTKGIEQSNENVHGASYRLLKYNESKNGLAPKAEPKLDINL